jgi:hypothetical protein
MRDELGDVQQRHRDRGRSGAGATRGTLEREPPATPFGDAVAALRAVVARHFRDDMPEDAVRRDLAPVVRVARACGVTAGQLVIAAKTVWFSWPAVRQDPAGTSQIRGLERLVSLCVERYYAGPGD